MERPTPARLVSASWTIDLQAVRRAGVAMVGLGLVLPALPHHPGLPCPLRTLTGVPCPSCGMTTAVEAAVSGHLRASLAANPFGVVAIIVALVILARPGWRVARIPWALLGSGALVSWLFELHRFGYLARL